MNKMINPNSNFPPKLQQKYPDFEREHKCVTKKLASSPRPKHKLRKLVNVAKYQREF